MASSGVWTRFTADNGSKNHKAGLVGPAFLLWNWFVEFFFDDARRLEMAYAILS
jgi:hypothetical protein